MKKKVLTTLLATTLLLTTGSAFADKTEHKNSVFGQPYFKIYKKLDLSKDQKQQIKTILKETRKQHKAEKPNKKQFLNEHHQLVQSKILDEVALNNLAEKAANHFKKRFIGRVKTEHKIWQLLTPEQQQKLMEYKAKRMEKRQKHMEKREKHKKGE